MMKRLRPEAGFTLIEVIVALTIFALMAGIIFSALRFSVNSYQRSQELIEEGARERILLDQVRRQIGSLFPLRPTAAFLQDPNAAEPPDAVSQLMNAQVPLFYGQYDFVTFVTVAPLVLTDNPGLTVVRYGLAENEFGELYLGSMETRFTGIDSFNEMADNPRGTPLSLVSEIRDLQFEYYGFDPDLQIYQWFEGWNGQEMFAVPEAIRIRFNEDQIVVPINTPFFRGGPRATGLQNLIRPDQ